MFVVSLRVGRETTETSPGALEEAYDLLEELFEKIKGRGYTTCWAVKRDGRIWSAVLVTKYKKGTPQRRAHLLVKEI